LRRVLPILMPLSMSLLPLRIWSDKDWQRIRQGYRSWDMDEKWNAFVEGDVAFVHRSWTGHGIFEASFVPCGRGGWRIAAAVVESDATRYRRSSEEYDRVILELVVSAIVLGEPATELRGELVELTARASGRVDVPPDAVQHSALGLRIDPTTLRPK
jgi:hypothetical protein